MKLITYLLGASAVKANVVAGGEGTPCPSDCWDWNATEQKCIIKEDATCFSLTCNHDSMKVNFASKLFAIEDTDASTVLDGPTATFDNDNMEWGIDCLLGECEMAAATEEVDSKNHLVFSFDVGKKMEKIVMSGNDVFIDPVSAALTFKCRYLAEVDLTSDQFTVKGATATGETIQDGTLDDGFGLVMYTDATYETVTNNENVFVGYPVYGKVDWSVTTAQAAVNFYIMSCNVQNADAEIAIVSDTCYSTTLGARQMQEDKLVGASSAFSFTAFTIGQGDQYAMLTTVACSIRLCLVADTDCQANIVTEDADCPTDAAYGYQAVTFQ